MFNLRDDNVEKKLIIKKIMKKSFGEILQSLCKRNELTQKELAKAISVSPKTIQEWIGKSGRIPRDPKHLKKLANYFDISLHYLLFGEDDPQHLIEDILDKSEIHTGLYEITIKKVKVNKDGQ
jgi:transcriptional regulator with XRE-family HTH domain